MKRFISKLGPALVIGVALLIPSLGQAIDRTVNCTAGQTITSVLRSLSTGDTLKVIGACSENVSIRPNNITLDGGGTATISGPDTTSAVIQISGRRATIQNFSSITGGRNGVQFTRGATGTVSGNTIQGVGTNGILVTDHSEARILNNTIQNNVNGNGIVVTDHSFGRIGFNTGQDTVASPNTITGNGTTSGDNGIVVTNTSFADIVGNTISNNGLTGGSPSGGGIFVGTGSSAEISSNTLNNNAQDGINMGRNSTVRLGRDTGAGIFDAPNSTTVNNGRNGIRCFINSSADGRQGTLNGTSGAADFTTGGCISSVIP